MAYLSRDGEESRLCWNIIRRNSACCLQAPSDRRSARAFRGSTSSDGAVY